ncbi:class I SAM-dependent methyltransferase [Candidatus Woesearchaeota archaeon]|nr:class I SAM-dependent methyltransferase [Candidatus Woesearchaeota archaeon]
MDYKKLYNGEHLKQINPHWTFRTWSYRHTFVSKMKYIEKFLQKVSKEAKILDAGCGQGLLVQEFKHRGYDIVGIDAFYGSEYVKKADLMKSGFKDNTFDLILCLDVIEHFQLNEQEEVIKELTRICKHNGKIVWSIPNLAHLSSRIYFMMTGKLLRTAKVAYHPGDRPIAEYLPLLQKHLKIEKKKGISPTIPGLFQIIQLFPQYTGWLYWMLKPWSVVYNWCFNVVVVTRKK